jgi:hypothetical protein
MSELFRTLMTEKFIEKGLSPASIKLYLAKAKKLNSGVEISNLNFLKKTEDIKKQLDAIENLNTRKSYVTAIVSLLRESKKLPKLLVLYQGMMIEMIEESKDIDPAEKTQKQMENWMTWPEVEEVYKTLKTNVLLKPVSEVKYNIMSKRLYADYMLLSLYVLFPPRRALDYFAMVITKDGVMEDETLNYYNVRSNKFVFNVYKTAGSYGQESFEVSPYLQQVILDHIEAFELTHMSYLLRNQDNVAPESVNWVTKTLNRIFDKKISVSMLRHIYLTSAYGETVKKMELDSKAMSHSTTQQREYIKE